METINYKTRVGNNINKYRRENDITLKELAKRVGITEGTMQKYEAGQIKRVDVEMINKIAQGIGVHPTQLTEWNSEADKEKAHLARIEQREEKWINKYQSLSFENQKKVNNYIIMVERHQDYSTTEQDIITMFRTVSEDTQCAVIDTLKNAYNRCIEREKTKAQ